MSNISIRQIYDRELFEGFFNLNEYAFRETPPFRDEATREKILPYQAAKAIFTVFEDENPVSTAASIPMTQNIRGKIFDMGGVASVSTMPEARRKGYVHQLMMHLFEDMAEKNQPISSLYPFRESFYGRLGYVGFPQMRILQFSPHYLQPLLKQNFGGRIEVAHIKEVYDTYRAFMKKIQHQIHGLGLHPDGTAQYLRDYGEFWTALAYDNDDILVGIMVYKLKGFRKDFQVRNFHFTNSHGKYLLLQWLARHADQVKDIWIKARPTDFAETWFYDLEMQVHSRPITIGIPTPMGRVVIVEQLNGIPTGNGSFTATISDDYCPWNNGTYRFETVDNVLIVSPAATADCDLTIEGLSALIFGGYDVGDLVYRGWGNPSRDVQKIMKTMFPIAYPFLHADY